MNLREAAKNISKDWREIILKLLDSYPLIEDSYEKESSNFNKIYPKVKDIFNCFNYFNLNETKVVILGQDPYHGEGQANGLAFAVNNNIKIPPSLRNILKKIDNPKHDKTLVKWAKQGVLLLNCALTVKYKTPRSYLKLWKPFTIELLTYIVKQTSNVVFVSWGGFAFDIFTIIQPENNKDKNHKLLICSHPSPLGYNKLLKGNPSFKDFDTFSEVNNFLGKQNKIDW